MKMLHYYDKILRLKSKLIVGKTGKQSRVLGHTWPVGTKVTWIWIALSWIIIYKETYKLTCEFLEKKLDILVYQMILWIIKNISSNIIDRCLLIYLETLHIYLLLNKI